VFVSGIFIIGISGILIIGGLTHNTQPNGSDVEIVTSKAAMAGSSEENLVRAQEAIQRHDEDAVIAMMADGRAFLVPKGTSVYVPGYWEDQGVSLTIASIRSGTLIGKKVYMFSPVQGTQKGKGQ